MTVQVRLFIGFAQNKELKIHLSQSAKWKEAKLLGTSPLTETSWQEKDYLGFFIPQLTPCVQLKEKAQAIKTELQIYCPKLSLDKHSIFLFSQLFLA